MNKMQRVLRSIGKRVGREFPRIIFGEGATRERAVALREASNLTLKGCFMRCDILDRARKVDPHIGEKILIELLQAPLS